MSFPTLPAKFSNRIYVHIPFYMLVEKLDMIIRAEIQPEIYFNADVLESPPVAQLEMVKQALQENGLGCTIHGPFMDLCPGAVDKKIRQVTLQRLLSLIRVAAEFSPEVVVFHPGYDDLRYGEAKELWFENSLSTWYTVLEEAQKHGLTLALENIFDKDPLLLARLINTINSPQLTHCFDVGHYNLFSDYPLADWFDLLGPHTVEVHLHDNRGSQDEHLALGDGSVNLVAVFSQLQQRRLQPALTIEAHTEERVFKSLERIGGYLE
jgi:sugar phosphate isomerase/epimerase